METIGITTTVPVEVILAAGFKPVDLNNIFITHPNPNSLVEEAEVAGYPRNLCGWIKGIYGTVLANPDIKRIIAVTQGDCSNTHALMESLQVLGVETIPFAFPYDRDKELLRWKINKLINALGATWEKTLEVKSRLDQVRQKVWQLDRLTWQGEQVSGFDNHLYQVCCSDFNGDVDKFEAELDQYLAEIPKKPVFDAEVRLGYLGVPPIMPDIYEYLEARRARVVFNEVQRQFSMPFETDDIVEQYLQYTYPYDIFARIKDIEAEIEKRNLDGLIHYTQSFCFRQIQDLILREKVDVPILTIEGDKPGRLDARTKMRIDAFVDMLR